MGNAATDQITVTLKEALLTWIVAAGAAALGIVTLALLLLRRK